MPSEKKVYHDLAERLYKSKQGATVLGKTFYPKKVRSCYDCHFNIFDCNAIKSKGCSYFDTEVNSKGVEKPIGAGICFPVRADSHMSEAYAERVRTWLEENKHNFFPSSSSSLF